METKVQSNSGLMRIFISVVTAAAGIFAVRLVDAQTETRVNAIEEVTVTAQRRESTLQEVTQSVAVFTGENLAKLGAADLQDFMDTVPGVAFATSGISGGRYILRGSGGVTVRQAPTTGIYYDETPLHYRTTFGFATLDPLLYDIARVEVLRGPQGALFGSSTMGGAIRMIPNAPDLASFSASVDSALSFTKDGSENYELAGMVNTPISKNAALRLVAKRLDDGGWIDDLRPDGADVFENMNNPVGIRRDVNSSWQNAFRAALLFAPDSTLTITPAVFYQEGKTDGGVYKPVSDLTFGREARLNARYQDTFTASEALIASLKIEKSFDWAGGVDFVSATSWLDHDLERTFDLTTFGNGGVNERWPTGDDRQIIVLFRNTQANEQLTQEFRFSTNWASKFNLIAGLFLKRATQLDTIVRPITDDRGTGAADAEGVLADTAVDVTEEEISAFGELTYDVSDSLELAIGGRWFSYDYDDERAEFGVGGREMGAQTIDFAAQTSEDVFSPSARISYFMSPDLTLYLSYAEGFRSGGVNPPISPFICPPERLPDFGIANPPPPFEGDKTKNTELGIKARFFQRALVVNAAVYAIDWENFQQGTAFDCRPEGTLINFTSNAGAVSSNGFELEFSSAPIEGLYVSGGVGYTDAQFDNEVPALGLAAGERLFDVPEWTYNLRTEYETPLNNFGMMGFIRGGANYVGDSISAFSEGGRLPRPSYAVVNASIGVRRESWELAMFVDNLTDEVPVYALDFAASTSTTNHTNSYQETVGRPRTFGLKLRAEF